jgi:formate dehydrogenase major subunit
LRYGIPAHRLPKDALDAEIEIIRKLGAEFQLGVLWGRDFVLAELRRRHQAVFLAIGAQRAQELRCEGEELALSGVEFLDLVARGNPPSLGDDVVVIGGGNTAMDCSRAAARLNTRSVRVLYRRTQREMPCLLSEAEEAQAEGVQIEFLVAPVRLERNGDHRLTLTCQRMELGEPDSSGRRRPVPVAGSEFIVSCSTVIGAIGQAVERAQAEREGLRVTGWGIADDERTLQTNLPGVFAAASIDQHLHGEPVVGESAQASVAMKPVDDDERARIFRDIEKSARVKMPEIDRAQRLAGFDEVELGLTDAAAEREARRCLSCGCRKADCCGIRALATEYGADVYRFAGARRQFTQDLSHPDIIYEPGKCIMCEACVRLAAQAGEPVGLTTTGRGFEVTVAVPFGKPLSEGLQLVARCAAELCPSGALALRTPRSCDLIPGPRRP